MVSVTSASHYITSASRYHPRYQSRSSMYKTGLIPRNLAELAEAAPIAVTVSQQMKVANIMSSSQAEGTKSTSFLTHARVRNEVD